MCAKVDVLPSSTSQALTETFDSKYVQRRKRPVTKQDKGKNLASDRAMHDQCIHRSMCSIAFYVGSGEVIKYSETHERVRITDTTLLTGQPEKNY